MKTLWRGRSKRLIDTKSTCKNLPYSSPAEIVGLGPNATQEYTAVGVEADCGEFVGAVVSTKHGSSTADELSNVVDAT